MKLHNSKRTAYWRRTTHIIVAVMFLLLVLSAGTSLQTNMSYRITVENTTGDISITNVTVIAEPAPRQPSQTGPHPFSLRLVAFNGSTLHEQGFTFEQRIHGHVGGIQTIQLPIRSVHVPYYPAAAQAQVLDAAGSIQAQRSLTALAACNQNGTCDRAEAAAYCPTDCAAERSKNPVLPFIAASIILVTIVAAIVLYRRKNRETEEREDIFDKFRIQKLYK